MRVNIVWDDFWCGAIVAALLTGITISFTASLWIINLKSQAVDVGAARYVVIDNRGHTEFQWITNKIEQTP